MYTTSAVLLAALSLASAKTIDVQVGQNGLTFTPNIVTASPGDKVDFHYFPKNHSVVQSSFAAPCVPIKPDGGIFSGFQPTKEESKLVFEVTVNDTTPIWIYCAQAMHCQTGMSMVINQPNNNKTLAAYQASAKSVSASGFPPHINGGIFFNATSTSNATATGTSGSASASGTSSGSSGSGSGSSGSGSGSSGSGSGSSGSGSSGSNTAAGPSSSTKSFTGAATSIRADFSFFAVVAAIAAATML